MDFGGHVGTFTFMKTEQHHLETNMRFKKKPQIISKMSGICMFFVFLMQLFLKLTFVVSVSLWRLFQGKENILINCH